MYAYIGHTIHIQTYNHTHAYIPTCIYYIEVVQPYYRIKLSSYTLYHDLQKENIKHQKIILTYLELMKRTPAPMHFDFP